MIGLVSVLTQNFIKLTIVIPLVNIYQEVPEIARNLAIPPGKSFLLFGEL
jgi:hypothetical protein